MGASTSRIEKLLYKLNEFALKRWALSALAITIPVYLLPVVMGTGKYLGLLDQNRNFTPLGLSIVGGLWLGSAGYAVLQSYGAYRGDTARRIGYDILQRMKSAINAIVEVKLARFTAFVADHDGKLHGDPFYEITQPRKQIEAILSNLRICLSEICDIRRENIGLSIIFRISEHGDWEWLHTIGVDGDLKLEEILGNPNSTARQIIDGKEKSLFFPDKREGRNQQKYIEGHKDKPTNCIGSILCQDISIGRECSYMQAILTISTYGKQLCEANDEKSKQDIQTVILPEFVSRLRLELALLYIREFMAVGPAHAN